jgi:hypothetical protein
VSLIVDELGAQWIAGSFGMSLALDYQPLVSQAPIFQGAGSIRNTVSGDKAGGAMVQL